ncbi:MAG TPA: ComEC/Rec2 family competence protein [Acidobacteriaceae bacterium]|nr:ComEC/Rec2 family competence protein [Acidobacteriaceae bacterium]
MATATIPAAASTSAQSKSRGRARSGHGLAAPALAGACGFAVGILCAHFFWLTPGWLLTVLLMLFAVAAAAGRIAPRLAWPAAGLLYVVLGILCAEIAPAVDQQKQLALLADNTPRVVEGEVVRLGPVRKVTSTTPFSTKTYEEHSQQIDVRLQFPADSTVRVTLYAPVEEPFPRVGCGDRVRATLAMHGEERFLDPGVWDAGEYLLRQGVGALASAKPEKFAVTGAGRRRLGCRLHSLQLAASARIIDYADGDYADEGLAARMPGFLRLDFLRIGHDDAAMLAAMLTGDRSYLQRGVRVGFERTGSFHLLVVSGLHLAIFSGLVLWLARRLRFSRVWATAVTVACSFGYAVFTGFGHPVQRAFWMVTLYLAGRLLWRERAAMNTIGVVALVMLAADPSSLFDSGLQMTLLSVVAIAGFAAPAAERTFAPYLGAMRNLGMVRIDPALPPRVAQFRVSVRMMASCLQPVTGGLVAWKAFPFAIRLGLRMMELLLVSFAIELFMMMPMAAYFHRVTLLALPVNLLIVPFLGVLLPSALLTFAAILIAPSIAFIPAAVTAAILHTVVWIVATFSGMRAGDLRIPAPDGGVIALWIGLGMIAMGAVRMRRFGLPAAVVALALGAAVIVLPHPMTRRSGDLEVTTIDVGQGDSLLVVTPDGKTLLIDAGGLVGASPESNFDVGEDVVSPVLWSRGIRRLDAVAITHAHADHIGGMGAVLANFRPRELWVGKNPDVPQYDRLLDEAAQLGTRIVTHTAGDAFSFGSTAVRVLAPERDYQPGKAPANNDSLVLRVSYGGTSALLEGDAEAPSEARMVAEGGLRSDLLKVGHHGSRTSTTPGFLAAVEPAYAAISVGRRNFYGHPRHEVLEELQAAHVATFRTDMLGLTSFYLDGRRVTAEPWAATQIENGH